MRSKAILVGRASLLFVLHSQRQLDFSRFRASRRLSRLWAIASRIILTR